MFNFEDITRAKYYFVIDEMGVIFTDTAIFSTATLMCETLAEETGMTYLTVDHTGILYRGIGRNYSPYESPYEEYAAAQMKAIREEADDAVRDSS